MIRPSVLHHPGVRLDSIKQRRSLRTLAERTLTAARQRNGKVLVVAGWVIALVGVIVYCAASFAASSDADLAAVVFHGAIPGARAGLLVIGIGTLTWIVGSVLHTIAVLDADGGEPGGRGDDSGRSGTDRRGS